MANLAAGKTPTCDSVYSALFICAYVNDEDEDTRWASASVAADQHWVYIDLGEAMSVGAVAVKWEAAYSASYKIQSSPDGSTWADRATGLVGAAGWKITEFTAYSARYWRIFSVSTGVGTNPYNHISIYEFEIYLNFDAPTMVLKKKEAWSCSVKRFTGTIRVGSRVIPRPPILQSFALSPPATRTGTATCSGLWSEEFLCSYINDENEATRWASNSDTAAEHWAYIDLGEALTVECIRVLWEAAYSASYKIQSSPDAAEWTDVLTGLVGAAGWKEHGFMPTSARYWRLISKSKDEVGNPSGHISIFEIELLASGPGAWDFVDVLGVPCEYRELDSSQYVSPDCSLHGTSAGAGEVGIALVKASEIPAADLKQGRIVCWFRQDTVGVGTGSSQLYFRCQHTWIDTYYLHLNTQVNGIYFRKNVATVPTVLASTTWAFDADTWYKIRITWWTIGSLFLMMAERWDGDDWVTLIDKFIDGDPAWGDIGGTAGVHVLLNNWKDDVEIWAP